MIPSLQRQAYCLYRMNRLSEALALLQSGEKTAGTLQLEGQVRKLDIHSVPGMRHVLLECYEHAEHATEVNRQALISCCFPWDKSRTPTGKQHGMCRRLQSIAMGTHSAFHTSECAHVALSLVPSMQVRYRSGGSTKCVRCNRSIAWAMGTHTSECAHVALS